MYSPTDGRGWKRPRVPDLFSSSPLTQYSATFENNSFKITTMTEDNSNCKIEEMKDIADSENKGYVSNEEVYKVMVEQMKLQQEIFGLKRMSMVLVFVTLLLSVATLATSFAAATLAKDTTVVDGNLVGKSDGSLVATRSHGSEVVATVDVAYVARVRRRELGIDTEDDRRFLQQEGGEVVATVSSQQMVDAYTGFVTDGAPITVSVMFESMLYTELVSGSGLVVSEEVDGTWYIGLHAQEIPDPTYNVHCASDAQICVAFQIGELGTAAARMGSLEILEWEALHSEHAIV